MSEIKQLLNEFEKVKISNRGTGAGGAKTNENGKTFEELTNNESRLVSKGFNKTVYNKKYDYAEIVIIDESQFYGDLYEFMRSELFSQTNKKMFIVAGLSGDYKMEPIGDVLKLIPMADEIQKLDAYCIYCKDGTLASFTSKLINTNAQQIVVGNDDIYSPCCRYHFLSFYNE